MIKLNQNDLIEIERRATILMDDPAFHEEVDDNHDGNLKGMVEYYGDHSYGSDEPITAMDFQTLVRNVALSVATRQHLLEQGVIDGNVHSFRIITKPLRRPPIRLDADGKAFLAEGEWDVLDTILVRGLQCWGKDTNVAKAIESARVSAGDIRSFEMFQCTSDVTIDDMGTITGTAVMSLGRVEF